MDYYTIHTLWTLVAIALFVGIVVWAWSGKRKAEFEHMARLPLEDDLPQKTSKTREENNNG